MIEKTFSINNFIGIYDNYITHEDCDKAIKLYEDQNKFNKTINRLSFEQAPIIQKQDQQYFAAPWNVDVWWEQLKTMMFNFDLAWKHYEKKYRCFRIL